MENNHENINRYKSRASVRPRSPGEVLENDGHNKNQNLYTPTQACTHYGSLTGVALMINNK